MKGDTLVIISGSGFSSIEANISVTIGDLPCTLITNTTTSIECKSPPSTALGEKVLLVTVTNDQSGDTVSANSTFTYDQLMTPTLTSVNQTLLTPYQLVTMVFQLENMPSQIVVDDISMKIGNDIYGFNDCTVVSLETNELEVIYFVSGVGVLKPILNVSGIGKGESDIEFNSNFKITDFTPKVGSIFGGTLITITGEGFPVGENDRTMAVNIRNVAWC